MKKNKTVFILFFLILGIGHAQNKENRKKKTSVMQPEFSKCTDRIYMGTYEVTQGNYLAFLNDLKSKGEVEKYKAFFPDTTSMHLSREDFNEFVAQYFFIHHPLLNYPITNISYEAASAYCDWFTHQYNANPKRKFKKVRCRLPSATEWQYAASGGHEFRVYPWGCHLKDLKSNFLANFLRI